MLNAATELHFCGCGAAGALGWGQLGAAWMRRGAEGGRSSVQERVTKPGQGGSGGFLLGVSRTAPRGSEYTIIKLHQISSVSLLSVGTSRSRAAAPANPRAVPWPLSPRSWSSISFCKAICQRGGDGHSRVPRLRSKWKISSFST